MQGDGSTDSASRKPANERDVYQLVRAGFTLKGTSLAAWCRDNVVTRQWAEQVLKGQVGGPAARQMRARIMYAAGVTNGVRKSAA